MSRLVLELPPETLQAVARMAADLVLEEQRRAGAGQEGYLAPAAAAEYLGISKKRIYDLKSSRAIEPDGFDGRTPLFTRATLDAYVRGGLTHE